VLLNNLHQTKMNIALGNALIDHLLKLPPKDWNAYFLKVERDEAICAKIQEALTAFYARFDAALAQMKGHGKR